MTPLSSTLYAQQKHKTKQIGKKVGSNNVEKMIIKLLGVKGNPINFKGQPIAETLEIEPELPLTVTTNKIQPLLVLESTIEVEIKKMTRKQPVDAVVFR